MNALLVALHLLAVPLLVSGDAQDSLPPALSSLVNTEREFAATSLKEGIRASFLKYFAKEGISLTPKPHVYRKSALKTRPPADPLARTLYWEPIVADVSISGDLGYTMGPSSLKEKGKGDTPVWYGFFFSIWKKQADGSWKVAVDVGTGSTKIVEQYFGQPLRLAAPVSYRPGKNAARGKRAAQELLACEEQFSKEVKAHGVRGAYQEFLDPRARAMREGLVPLAGKEAILAYLVKGTAPRFLQPMHADASKAGDMGYTYGAYREKGRKGNPAGYYERVWRRDSKGNWRIVVEVAVPVQ